MQTKKNRPNNNVNDSNAEQNASLDLDLTCWIFFKESYLWKLKKQPGGKKLP